VGWAPHGFDVSRRTFFATIAGVLGMGTNAPTLGTQTDAPGLFQVKGVVSESQEPDVFYLGIQFGLIAAPRTEPHRILRSKVGTQVRVYVEPA
jgi:hypothetical protein